MLRPDLGGGPAAREPGLGTGRGGDVTGSANSFLSARRNRGGRGAWFTKRDPHVRIGLRLAFYEAVAGLGPRQDLRLLIVENEFAAIGLHREYGVTVARQNEFVPNQFILKAEQPSGLNALEIASKLDQADGVEFATPNFISEYRR